MVIEIEGGDQWKEKARSLQLQLRDRFRVAVDRHRRRPSFSDGYFSSRIQLWLERFHNFRRDSLPSSPTFYLKKVSKDIDAEGDSVLTRMLQAVAVPVIGNVCHVFMHGLNHVQVYGAEKLHQALQHRPKNKSLITVTVLIGDPIEFDDLFTMEENRNMSRGKLYDAVSARIGDHIQKLKAQVDRLALKQSLKSQNYPSRCTERATGILRQVDWESLGMENYIGALDDRIPLRQDFVAEQNIDHIDDIKENDSPNRYFRMGFSYGDGMVSRIRGYMDPTELMGFAARGLFMSCRVKGSFENLQGDGPLKTWKSFMVSHVV